METGLGPHSHGGGSGRRREKPFHGVILRRLILDSRMLTEEPRGTTIGPMSDSRSYLPSKDFGCCDGKHCPSAGTEHGFGSKAKCGSAPGDWKGVGGESPL